MGRIIEHLLAWQRAMELAESVYATTKHFPPDERFTLTSQMRRAAVSIASNIAEGQGRFSPGEFRQFLSNAMGSARELETQILLARRLQYIEESEFGKLLGITTETCRFISRLASADLRNHGDYVRNKR
jgi:four helix bundle protein